MQLLEGALRNYSWGSTDLIPNLVGKQPDGTPVAEMWFGAHPAGPSLVGGRRLNEVIEEDPRGQLGERVKEKYGARLPFLLKLLAADEPLSLQAHPTMAQATEGFERENTLGIPLGANERNYKDPSHKPELIVALTKFQAMAGFRPLPATLELFEVLNCAELNRYLTMLDAAEEQEADNLRALFTTWITIPRTSRHVLIEEVVQQAANHLDRDDWISETLTTVIDLNNRYPGDIGVLGALLLNHIQLEPGEAIFLNAGQLHAYVSGLGVEIMANSDNVLRGGLTSKYVDVPELVKVLDFESLMNPRSLPELTNNDEQPETWEYPVPVDEFKISRVELPERHELGIKEDGPVIVLCTSGSVVAERTSITDGEVEDRIELNAGDALWISAQEGGCTITGDAAETSQLFVAKT